MDRQPIGQACRAGKLRLGTRLQWSVAEFGTRCGEGGEKKKSAGNRDARGRGCSVCTSDIRLHCEFIMEGRERERVAGVTGACHRFPIQWMPGMDSVWGKAPNTVPHGRCIRRSICRSPLTPTRWMATTMHNHGTISPARGEWAPEGHTPVRTGYRLVSTYIAVLPGSIAREWMDARPVKRAWARFDRVLGRANEAVRLPSERRAAAKKVPVFPTTRLGESWTCGQCARMLPCIHCPCLLSPCTARGSEERSAEERKRVFNVEPRLMAIHTGFIWSL